MLVRHCVGEAVGSALLEVPDTSSRGRLWGSGGGPGHTRRNSRHMALTTVISLEGGQCHLWVILEQCHSWALPPRAGTW